jgi:hypothetical protein
MLQTCVAPFDFHAPKGGRRRFAEFASSLSAQFDTPPQIVDEPIFSYTRRGQSQLDRLRKLDESRPAVVYLSNVVMHAALLIVGNCDAAQLMSPFRYDSLDAFYHEPFSRGFGIGRDTPLNTCFDGTTVVISDLARFRNDDDELPNDGLFRVQQRIDDVFVCNVLDYGRYFAHALVCGDEPFFLSPEVEVDFRECVKQRGNDSLREYLLDQSVPFATLGDDHMDDEYAVSYGMNCWGFADEDLAFAR